MCSIVLAQPSSAGGRQDSIKCLSIEDYGFYLEWAGFGQHADTALIPNLEKQITSAELELGAVEVDLKGCETQKRGLIAVAADQNSRLKKAQRGKRWAIVGNVGLAGLVAFLLLR